MPIAADKILEELFKFRLAQLRSDSEGATGSITQITRVIGYGLVALIIPLVTSDPSRTPPIVKDHPLLVLFAAMMGGVAIACDVAQNHFVDLHARQEIGRVVSNLQKSELVVSSPPEFMSSVDQPREKAARKHFYWLKIMFTAIGAVVLFVTILVELATS
jgi:hypothetical protein